MGMSSPQGAPPGVFQGMATTGWGTPNSSNPTQRTTGWGTSIAPGYANNAMAQQAQSSYRGPAGIQGNPYQPIPYQQRGGAPK